MVIQKISLQRESLGEIAYRHLFEAFLNDALIPGTRLLMDDLAEQMGISRTPIREALQRLEREGVIEAHGRRGYVVRETTAEELNQQYQARSAIERFAMEQLTIDGDAGPRLRAMLDELTARPQETADQVFRANRDFHRGVLEMLDNELLEEMFDLVWNRGLTSGIWAKLARDEDCVEKFYADHLALIESIESGDIETAHVAGLAHINAGRAMYEI
ncbi:GntR family transcriptional regulator [Leucobacter insecticola]|uniref:GntR family transcriptional regulator n=1 Tax=Leucobacter insecticola TaxID=2714934 RepID=A0A6G8FL06_9MICO|nr:GntR family transcriptional regulator [Leucobacter insecticola]QIM17018.1 GntR family transcriptional regulator [Leucobacter insecticola]